jgi:hypothetical protein
LAKFFPLKAEKGQREPREPRKTRGTREKKLILLWFWSTHLGLKNLHLSELLYPIYFSTDAILTER